MIKTLTFVKRKPHLSRIDFFQRWCEHTRDWDLRDHPEISLNRLMLIEDDRLYDGVAENDWPDADALAAAVAWYATPAGQDHWTDLCSFMDMEGSVTVTVTREAVISAAAGIVPGITTAPSQDPDISRDGAQ